MGTIENWVRKKLAGEKEKTTETVIKVNCPFDNLQGINANIDYDKLADAIVSAQKRIDADKKEEESKKKSSSKYVFATISEVMFYLFSGICILGGVFAFGVLIISFIYKHFDWSSFSNACTSVSLIILLVLCTAAAIGLSILLFNAAREMETETDKHYIASVFSSMICFVALVVAVISLIVTVKGGL